MTQTNQIKQLLQSKNLWDNSFSIRPNPNIRGQSISYFIYSSAGVPIYIAKFFDYFKGIPLPDSIDINRCKDPDDMIERLAEADDFMGDIDNASDQFYYQKRSFLRYVQVCSEEEIGFPRIVAVKENIIINSHYYSLLIEKAINGVTLEDYLKAQTFSRNRVAFAISFLHKMADIIQKFISHGIVHRDLSPDNIMISNQELVVIDPGMVKFKNRNTTKLGCIMGKENYASPEQYYGQAVYTDFTSDLYTVGLIAFEIISGFNPLELYITKGCSHPHEEIIKKFDRELEDTFSSIKNYYDTTSTLTPDNTFLDPQLYYSTFEGNIFKHLEEEICYPTSISRRDWRKRTPQLMNYLEKHAENSADISNALITPGFFIQSLDWHFDYSIDIYEYCHENYDFEKYYLTLLVSNIFFHSKSDVDEMIEDLVDSVEHKDGIYFSICYDKTDEKDYEFIDPQNLANILYFVHSLKSSGFNIMVGYTFLNSILFAMLDCEYVASGWFNNIRKFSKERFDEVSNMGRRKKRYTSIPLFTYITFEALYIIDDEAMDIQELLSGCDIDEYVIGDPDAISFVDLEHQYWQALNLFIDEINTYNTLSEKTNFILSKSNHAKELYNNILDSLSGNREAYNQVKVTSKHLDSWIMGIETFKNRISLI